MSWRCLAVLVFLLTSTGTITGLSHSAGELDTQLRDHLSRHIACPAPEPGLGLQYRTAPEPGLGLQYRAALLLLQSEDVRREVALRCPGLSATLRCAVELARRVCRWRTVGRRRRVTHGSYAGATRESYGRAPHRRNRRGRSVSSPREARSGRWLARPHRYRRWREWPEERHASREVAPGEQRFQHRSGELRRYYPVARQRATRENQSWWRRLFGVHRTSEEAPAGVSGATYSTELRDTTFPKEYQEASYPTEYAYPIEEYSTPDFSTSLYRDTYPTDYSGATYHRPAQRRQYVIPPKVMLEVSPKIASCGGAFLGCLLCAITLELSNTKVPPAACVGPCLIGSGIACSGAMATMHKEMLKAQQPVARRDWLR